MRYYDELQNRLQMEWPEFPLIDTTERTAPKPLVALASSNALAGGLAFIAAKAPINEGLAIWINAVLVAPEYRRRGVGSRLIEAAQRAASRAGVPRLYALTEVPELYSKLGWSVLSNKRRDFVMFWDARGTDSSRPHGESRCEFLQD